MNINISFLRTTIEFRSQKRSLSVRILLVNNKSTLSLPRSLFSCNNPKEKSHRLLVEGTGATPASELAYRIRHPRSALLLTPATSSNRARYLSDSSSSNEQTAIIQQRVK